jgi:YVTN family beta-propeller protein
MRFGLHPRSGILLCVFIAAVAAGAVTARGRRQSVLPAPLLPTGRAIAPQGAQTEVGSFPVNMALSPDGKWIAVTTTGFRQYLSLLSAADGRLVSQLPFNTPLAGSRAKTALYVGLAFGPAKPGEAAPLYVSRGPEDRISLFSVDAEGRLTDTGRALEDPSELPKEAGSLRPNFIAGIALSATGARLYAVHNETSAWTKYRGSVSILDIASHRVVGRVTTPGFPYAIAAVTKGVDADRKVYVSSERDGVVSALDVADPAHPRPLRDIKTGDHPMALLLDGAQRRLFVANASSDTLSVIDTAVDRVIETVSLRRRLDSRFRGLPGLTPTGLALSPDQTRLYVSLADMNAVAVVDVKKGATLQGFLPAGWYPTAVIAGLDGAHLFVANAKGVRARNPNKEQSGPEGAWGQYIENLLEGTVSLVSAPSDAALEPLTNRVLVLNGLRSEERGGSYDAGAPPLIPKGIKHILYIIKENRTYDEVLGDLPQGNGDAGLVLFGRSVTPNQHALAERFVLLDNFYDCAEVSADGWNWSTSGMTSEYAGRNVHFSYSGRGRSYDYEGENNSIPVDLIGQPDVARAPGGYLWDLCARRGLTYRAYGFFNAFADAREPDGKLLVKANAPTRRALVGHTDEDFLRFDMSYADSDAWKIYNCPSANLKQSYGAHNAPSRFAEWKREFDAFVKKGALPRLMMIRFPRDHTQGTTPGQNSPRAMVADNDYAVGQLVEAVSSSPFWKETAIFILEDDAQDGFDHVDAHRSICFVASPYIARGRVDHGFYNTDSVLHTMEALSGLPPMCQYDAAAPVIDAFGEAPTNLEPYRAILPDRAIVAEINTRAAYRARDSQKLDFAQADRVPEGVLNDILWHSVKGAQTPEPSVQRRPRSNKVFER